MIILSKNVLTCANVGDSKSALISEENGLWKIESISWDHKPSIPQEKIWIEACGG